MSWTNCPPCDSLVLNVGTFPSSSQLCHEWFMVWVYVCGCSCSLTEGRPLLAPAEHHPWPVTECSGGEVTGGVRGHWPDPTSLVYHALRFICVWHVCVCACTCVCVCVWIRHIPNCSQNMYSRQLQLMKASLSAPRSTLVHLYFAKHA